MTVVEEPRAAEGAGRALPGLAMLTIVAMSVVALGVLRFGSGRSPLLPVVTALGAAAVPVLLRRPQLTLAALVAFELSNAGVVLGEHGIPGLGTAMLIVSTLAAVAGTRRGELRFTWSPIYTALAVFLAVRLVTVLLSADPGGALGQLTEAVRAVVFLVVVATLASAKRGIRVLAWSAIVTAAALAGISIVQEFVFGNSFDFFGFSKVPLLGDLGASTARHAGPQEDANFWARTLVLFPPLALSVWAATRHRLAQGFWLAAFFALVGGIYLTQSRGGLITVGFTVIVWMAIAGPRSRRLLLAVPSLLVLATLTPGVGSRLSTLGDLGAASEESGDPSLIGRVAVQRLGLEMFLDNPATGVGSGNFIDAEEDYQRDSGLTYSRLLAPHNLYLEMAAEGGIAGLAAWLLFYAVAVWLAVRCLLLRASKEVEDALLDRLLPLGVIAALAGWAVASIFLHLAGLRLLFLVIALGVALDARARRLWHSSADRLDPEPPPARPHARSRQAAVLAVALAVFVLMAVVTQVRSTKWRADAPTVLQARVDEARDDQAYDHDIATREFVRKTVAATMSEPNVVAAAEDAAGVEAESVDVAAVPSGTSSTITIRAEADRRDEAEDVARSVRASGADILEELEPTLELIAAPGPVVATRVTRLDARAASTSLLSALAVTWVAGATRWIRTRTGRSLPA